MSGYRLATVAALLAACGSNRPAADTATADVKGDAGPELPPTVVKGALLETHRLTGTPTIEPDPDDRTPPAGQKSLVAATKICVDTAGKVSTVKLLKSSGRPSYDAKIERAVKSWTFRPVMGDGQPVDVCTVMTFTYRPTSPPPPAP